MPFKLLKLRSDLGLQLLALYLLFVIPVVIAALIFDQYANRRLRSEIEAADLALAHAIAEETDTVMENALVAVRQLAAYPEVIEADVEGMKDLFAQVNTVRPDVNLIYRLGADGIMIFHHPVGPGSTVGVDFSIRKYYQRAKTTREPIVSLGRISPTTEQAVATAVMPLWGEGDEFLGVVATNIMLESLSTTLTSISTEHQPRENFEVMIVDAAGRIIAHPNPDEFLLVDAVRLMPEVTKGVLQGDTGNLIDTDQFDQEMLYTYVPVQSAGWGVIISRPTSAAFATPRAFHRVVFAATGAFLAIGLFFWIALSQRVLNPLETLASFSQTIGRESGLRAGQRRALEKSSKRPDQMGHLIRSFTRMERAIEARINELSTLLQTSAAVVSTLDSQNVLDRILEQVGHLLDTKMCAIVALDEGRGVFRAQASRGLSKRYAEQIAIDPEESSSVSMRAIRSGQPVQVSDTEKDATFTALRPRARAEGYRSILAIPLNTTHAPPSVLIAYRSEPHEFSQREINLLTSFANHAAMAIENAELFARSDARLQEQTRRLEALIQSMEDGLILENLQGKVLYANRRIQDLTGLQSDEIAGAPIDHLLERLLVHAAESEKTRAAIEQSRDGGPQRSVEFAVNFPSGIRYLRFKFFTVTDSSGLAIGHGQILQDITKRHELDRMKSSLISTVSHELRTPLAAIKGYATTLLADDVDWELQAQREFLEIISKEADRLSDLVTNLLDMSRIEAGNLTVSRTYCHLGDLIQRAIERIRPTPGDRLQIDLPPDFPALYADPQRIEVILRNLIENAAKYSADGAAIRVSAECRGGQAIVRVEDEGPGIPPEHSQKIFHSFYRLDNGLTRKTPGAGLGLTISQGFVRAHGGEIWLEPRSRGACIAFSLPQRETVEPTQRAGAPAD